MLNAPCKGCTDRSVGCHAKCDRYDAFKLYVNDYLKKRRIARGGDYRLYKCESIFGNKKNCKTVAKRSKLKKIKKD